jgi:ATP-dependent Lon protease
MEDTNIIPLLPIRNTVVFPGITLSLLVKRPAGIAAIKKAQAGRGVLVAVTQKDGETEISSSDNLYRVGTVVKLEKVSGTEESGFQILVRGLSRFKIGEITNNGVGFFASGEPWSDRQDADAETLNVLFTNLKELAGEVLELLPGPTEQLAEMLKDLDDPAYLSHLCSANLDIPVEVKQELLSNVSLKSRFLTLLELLQKQREALALQNEIRSKMSQRIGKTHREALLREQMRTIQDELGEQDAVDSEDFAKRIVESGMPEDVRKTAEQELKRMERIGPNSPEAHVVRNYLDWLCSMPWQKSAKSEIDIEAARKILQDDHAGLEKIKKRILQYLAVMKLRNGTKGSILCLVGPPGVGKTSLGQSIAKALGRKFVRASLGGVRDEAEIRGHRRTYIGAMPGRLVQSLKRAGENNPVFMLDEIDKLSSSYHGDPASALLEVLDPEQNNSFVDHYLDVPFDLSNILFVATANSLDSIPAPLLDRMEVIEINGYTIEEKLHIAKKYLVPKQLAEHGLPANSVSFSDEVLRLVSTSYTREAGVRGLQRQIGALCRLAAEKTVSGETFTEITGENVRDALGPERFVPEVTERQPQPGLVTGLAWTPMGGEILFIEASHMPGAGRLTLTGQLGDVMKESAQIALSLVRSRLSALAPLYEYEKRDLHIHVPSGAIPKDGPSAGITMLTAVASLFTGRTVSPDLAMTGEITLRGAVLPVGGIKEKVIAAHRSGVKKVIISSRNMKDLAEVPEEVRRDLKFIPVDTAAEVLRIAVGVELLELAPPLPASGSSAVASA